MLLTRLKKSFDKKDYFLDEGRLVQMHDDDCAATENWLDYGYIDISDIYISNTYRKTLCILLYLLSKNGLCTIKYNPTDFVGGFNVKKYGHTICAQDENYQSAYTSLLKKYEWDLPEGWNTLCDGESYIMLSEEDEIVRSYEKKGDAEFAGELTDLVTLTLHCRKFDEVYRIYQKNKKDNMLAKDYAKIWRMMQEISFSAIVDFAEHEDTFFKNGKAYFVSCIDRTVEGSWGYRVKDLRTMLRPHLFFNIPILDRMMDRFIKKWEV